MLIAVGGNKLKLAQRERTSRGFLRQLIIKLNDATTKKLPELYIFKVNADSIIWLIRIIYFITRTIININIIAIYFVLITNFI